MERKNSMTDFFRKARPSEGSGIFLKTDALKKKNILTTFSSSFAL